MILNMKLLILISIFMSSIYKPVEIFELTVEIQNLTSNSGHVMLAIFNTSESFPDGLAKVQIVIDIKDKKGSTVFKLPEGNYAIAVYHDSNDNKKLDKNSFGIPKESYGFSNNAIARFSAPSFEDAKFTLNKNTIQKIDLN